MNTYVLYHGDCPDGFGAAYAAWRYFEPLGINAEYIPVFHGKPIPPIPPASHVYILDFSYSKEVLLGLSKLMGKLRVIDHHKTAQENLRGCENFCLFDMTKSGAVLAWEYFHRGKEVPLFLQYVQDRDLWKWELPYSKEVNICIMAEGYDFRKWRDLDQWVTPTAVQVDYRPMGEAILKHIDLQLWRLSHHVRTIPTNRGNIPIVNTSLYQSEIGNALLDWYPRCAFSISYYLREDGRFIFSLCSRGVVDVSEIAKSFGGGGHKSAAGFVLDECKALTDVWKELG